MAYIGNIPAEKYQTLQKQSFTTSATDTYTLSYSVTNPQDLALFINNVRQNPNDAYTVSGTTLTLSSAITSSDTMYAVFLGRAVETIAPATGSVTNAMLAGSIATSKLADGSTFATTNGITMADQWRLTSSFTGNADPITSNLAQASADGGGGIGSSMSVSSGVFTFPSTGIYLILAHFSFFRNANDRLIQGHIQAITDGSSSGEAGTAYTFTDGGYGDSSYTSTDTQFLFDVTSTSTHKVRFGVFNGGATCIGDANSHKTGFTFIRLGDT